MKYKIIPLLILLSSVSLIGQKLMPYHVSNPVSGSVSEISENLKEALKSEGFEIIGEYHVNNDVKSHIIAITHPLLIQSIQKMGGLTAMGTAIKISLTPNLSNINIAYTNPIYWGNAYFQDDYPTVQTNIEALSIKLESALKECCVQNFRAFGSKNGLTPKELRKYHYMFGMEYFEDVVELAEFSSFSAATTTIENNLKKLNDVALVYAYKIPDKQLKVYGIQLKGNTGEKHFLSIIDTEQPKHVSFLPYEILVMNDEVVMLHGRYRLALSFPDLTMTTFSKIMSTPGDIENLMKSVVK